MKETVKKILEEIRPDLDFSDASKKLIDDDILDSFDIISIVGEFNENFDIHISVEELQPENFNSLAAMVQLIEKLKGN